METLFSNSDREAATQFLAERYPSPQVITTSHLDVSHSDAVIDESAAVDPTDSVAAEVWVFSGQGSFDAELLSDRIAAYTQMVPAARDELDQCATVAQELLEGDMR